MSRFAIIGLGLIGGSIASAIRTAYADCFVIGFDRDGEACEAARRENVIDEAAAHVETGLDACDIVFVCTPLHTIPKIFDTLNTVRGPIVTDVAGSKAVVENWARVHLPHLPYVGSHPMAGGEQGGFAAARADLFEGAPVAVCPPPSGRAQHTDSVRDFWRSVGAKPVVVTAAEHDRKVAHTSHLPYLSALAQLQLLDDKKIGSDLIGRGFRDATRHAAFAPEIMAAVCAENPSLPQAARSLARALMEWADGLETNPDDLIKQAQRLREVRSTLTR